MPNLMRYMPNLCAIFLISQLYCEQIIKLHNINFNYKPNLCVICLTYVSYLSYHNYIVNHHPVFPRYTLSLCETSRRSHQTKARLPDLVELKTYWKIMIGGNLAVWQFGSNPNLSNN